MDVMDDVPGDILRPPHGTTLADVITNQIKLDPLSAKKRMNIRQTIQFRIINSRQ